jgi:hypothetical protein
MMNAKGKFSSKRTIKNGGQTMFTINKKDVTGYSTETHLKEMKWLASALADSSDGRFHVSHIWVRDNRQAIATDGKRMHIVEMTSLAPGYYRVIKKTRWSISLRRVNDEDTFDFPDVDVVLDDQKHINRPVVQDCQKDADIEYTLLIRKMDDNSIRYPLFVDAVRDMDSYTITYDRDCNHAFYIEDGLNRKAIVMPFRL